MCVCAGGGGYGGCIRVLILQPDTRIIVDWQRDPQASAPHIPSGFLRRYILLILQAVLHYHMYCRGTVFLSSRRCCGAMRSGDGAETETKR